MKSVNMHLINSVLVTMILLFTVALGVPNEDYTISEVLQFGTQGLSEKVILRDEEIDIPSDDPSDEPSDNPSDEPSDEPSVAPARTPSDEPSVAPARTPSDEPSVAPARTPSDEPSVAPARTPSDEPSVAPARTPSDEPSDNPSDEPSDEPSVAPARTPSDETSDAAVIAPSDTQSYQYPADGDWTYTNKVLIVAQSASKIYDGQPLKREQALVSGLPSGFSIVVSVTGSQTDVGKSANTIGNVTIYNEKNEDVTSHFSDITRIDGMLVVEPMPLYIWTGGAEKVYDGTPLTCLEAGVDYGEDYIDRVSGSYNLSYAITDNFGNTLYGICGTVFVTLTDPFTNVQNRINLRAGQKVTVIVISEAGNENIEFKVEQVYEKDIPEELLYLYKDNPALLDQACDESGWSIDIINERINKLSDRNSEHTVERYDQIVNVEDYDRLLENAVDAQVHISEMPSEGNALGGNELGFTEIKAPDAISITAKGSQTDAGESINSYSINWGDADLNNYTVNEHLGTLKVTPAEVLIETGSAEKIYDGRPLTNPMASITGLVNRETAEVIATGSITKAGSAINTYTIQWGTAKADNYNVSEELGTLTILDAYDEEITITAASAKKVYDGKTLTNENYSVSNLPEGCKVEATVEGSQMDAGISINRIKEYKILRDGEDITDSFTNVKLIDGTLEVKKAKLIIKTGSAEKVYDGKKLYNNKVTTTGLVKKDKVTANGWKSITDVGCCDNKCRIRFVKGKAENYNIQYRYGKLTVLANPCKIVLTATDAIKVYDGTEFRDSEVMVSGVMNGFTVETEVTGSRTEAGNSEKKISQYRILKNNMDVTDYFSNIQTIDGKLTVLPAIVEVKTESAEKLYDGSPLTNPKATITGLVNSETATVKATGTITDVGTVQNQYEIEWGTAESTNYLVSSELGTLTILEAYNKEVTLTAASAEKKYDGTALTDNAVEASNLPGGYNVEATVEGSQTDVGSSKNIIKAYKILKNGEDVTEKFTDVKLAEGTLTVTKASVKITTGTSGKTYDGAALTDPEATITGLVDGETATVTTTGSITNVGSVKNGYEIQWETAKESNYEITSELGTLTVSKAKLEISTGTAEKEYDGTALTDNTATITGLAFGETATVTATGSVTDAGSSENTYKIEWGTAKAGNYEITANLGTLTVKPLQVTFNLNCFDDDYQGCVIVPEAFMGYYADNTPVECIDDGYIYEDDIATAVYGSYNLIGGGKLYLQASGCKDAGTYTIIPTETFSGGEAGNYIITYVSNTMTISPATATVWTGSDEKEYDGTPLTNSQAGIDGTVGSEGDEITVTATGTITEEGSTQNTYTIDWGSVNPNNYNLEEKLGTLVIYKVFVPGE